MGFPSVISLTIFCKLSKNTTAGNYGNLTASQSHFQLNLCQCLCLGKAKKKKLEKDLLVLLSQF